MKIVCIGDSLTSGYGVKKSEAWTSIVEEKYGIEMINKGISGDTTTGMLARFYKDVVEHKPMYVMLMGGINDLEMGRTLEHHSFKYYGDGKSGI
ncbi:MAG: GDSL-type esterase/lipase family protein [Clostridia bacterium]|nr:GDSL-type esterase/lipase family protein [Clostridia bacterium]